MKILNIYDNILRTIGSNVMEVALRMTMSTDNFYNPPSISPHFAPYSQRDIFWNLYSDVKPW